MADRIDDRQDDFFSRTFQTVSPALPRNFRKLPVRRKRELLRHLLELDPGEMESSGGDLLDLADVMVESALGVMPVPLGVAPGFLVDDHIVNIPLAVEEPSVIAAASFAGQLIARRGGGFTTTGTGQVMTAQIALDQPLPGAEEAISGAERELHKTLQGILAPMTQRGGGYRGIEVSRLPEEDMLVVYLHVDTCDAMGANIINTAAEALRAPLERLSGGSVLMAILTNAAPRRRARASFSIPLRHLARSPFDGPLMGERIVRANQFARADRLRAVTHNKGIMNGISALATATGNDTRAVEAAAHAYASRSGAYRALTEYRISGDHLEGELELPLALGTVGGATGLHPVSSLSLKILFMDPSMERSASRLGRIAVALGLAQNLAALMALVSEGIQKGHMRQHARRLAWASGARHEEIPLLAEDLWKQGVFNLDAAHRLLQTLRTDYQNRGTASPGPGRTPGDHHAS